VNAIIKIFMPAFMQGAEPMLARLLQDPSTRRDKDEIVFNGNRYWRAYFGVWLARGTGYRARSL
jgi:hypothetical protein